METKTIFKNWLDRIISDRTLGNAIKQNRIAHAYCWTLVEKLQEKQPLLSYLQNLSKLGMVVFEVLDLGIGNSIMEGRCLRCY